MVIVGVVNKPTPGIRRYHHHRDAWAIAEEGERLDVSRVIIATSLIKRGEDRCTLKYTGLSNDLVDDVRGEGLKQGQRRGSRVAIIDHIGLNEGHCGQLIILHILLELREVLDVVPE